MRRMSRSVRSRRSSSHRNRRWPVLNRILTWYHDGSPWQRRMVMVGGAFSVVAALAGAASWAHRVDLPGRVAALVRHASVDVTLGAGFSVQEVYVTGRKETARPELLAALGAKIGDPILFFNAAAARERLIRLGWVEDARIERRLPNRIVVVLKERTPIAIWQRNKKFVLVDRNGEVIGPDGLQHYSHLKIIIGDDAPKHAADLLAMLARDPDMMRRVTHASWVSGRQWNIRIENAIDVRLPAENPEAAWQKLVDMERQYGVLKRDITAVDLRIPDQTTVRKNHQPEPAATRDNQT
jgi:cell division protein FtsQ